MRLNEVGVTTCKAAENPFRISNIHGLSFHGEGFDIEGVCEHFVVEGCRGALVGQHGNGKSTLLNEIGVHLEGQGKCIYPLLRTLENPRFTMEELSKIFRETKTGDVVLMDGAEQLPTWQWYLLNRLLQGNGVGLITTQHKPGRLPTLYHCDTSKAVMLGLLEQLCPESTVDLKDRACQYYDQHGGNIREVFFALYDDVAAGRIIV